MCPSSMAGHDAPLTSAALRLREQASQAVFARLLDMARGPGAQMEAWREAPEWRIGEAADAGGVERLWNRCPEATGRRPRHRPHPYVCGCELAALLVEYAQPESAHEAPPGPCPAGRLPVENGVVAVRTHGGCVRMIGSIFEIVHPLVLGPGCTWPVPPCRSLVCGRAPRRGSAFAASSGTDARPACGKARRIGSPTGRSSKENLNSTLGLALAVLRAEASSQPVHGGPARKPHAPGQTSTNGNRFRGAPVPADVCKIFLWRGLGLHAPTLMVREPEGTRSCRELLPALILPIDAHSTWPGCRPGGSRNGASESSHITYGYVTDPISRKTQEGP